MTSLAFLPHQMRRLSESDESVCELIDQQQLALVNFQTRISAVVADFQTAQSRQLSTARAQAQAVRERSEQRIRGIQLEHQQRSATAIGGGIDLEQRMTALEEVVAGITVEGTKVSRLRFVLFAPVLKNLLSPPLSDARSGVQADRIRLARRL